MNPKDTRIPLADWIANIRANLNEGIRRRKELEAANGGPLTARLLVEEITIEATIETERTEGLGPKFSCWIAELSGEKKTTNNTTQKVTIKLKPVDVVHLGEASAPIEEAREFLPRS